MVSLSPISPLLIAGGILLAGNGLQTTLLTLRAELEGFSPTIVGLMGTGYFLGFLVGTATVGRLIRIVGHIRVFSSLAAVAAAISLTLVIFIDPNYWIGARIVMGFCVSGLFTVVESWLNEATSNADRGQILSIYRIVDLSAVTASQLVIPVVGIDGFEIFSLMAVLFCLSLVPIALSTRNAPVPDNAPPFDLRQVWIISPMACIGVFAIGMSTSAFRAMGPLFASGIGLDLRGVATFMSAGIVGGAVLQLPLGLMSDRFDRRWVLIGATLGAALAGLMLALGNGLPASAVYGEIFVFGAFALPLYSLSVAHANDHAAKGQYTLLSAGLIFIYSLGATLGPFAASFAIVRFGPRALFGYIALVHLSLVAVAIGRLMARPVVPRQSRVRYTPLLRTSPAIFRLAKQRLAKQRLAKSGGNNGSPNGSQD